MEREHRDQRERPHAVEAGFVAQAAPRTFGESFARTGRSLPRQVTGSYAGDVTTTPSTRVLTDGQRAAYAEQGWLSVPGLVDDAWLERLRAVTDEFVDQSRALTESNVIFDLDAGHSADEPRLRRLSSPTDLHETYWEFASQSVIADVVVDLLGPDVKFHHSKLNFKARARRRRGEVAPGHPVLAAHQLRPAHRSASSSRTSSPAWARSASSPAATTARCSTSTTATCGSARSPTPTSRVPASSGAEYPDRARPGTITVHNCRTVHGSAPNRVGPAAAAAAADLRGGRRVLVHRPREAVAARRGADPRRAGALGPPRPAPVPACRRRARTGRSSRRSSASADRRPAEHTATPELGYYRRDPPRAGPGGQLLCVV